MIQKIENRKRIRKYKEDKKEDSEDIFDKESIFDIEDTGGDGPKDLPRIRSESHQKGIRINHGLYI